MTEAARQKTVERVRGLLRMAEDPAVTDAESQAFTAKAAELMTRHAIAEAEARAERGEEPDAISRMDYAVPGVGGHGKARVRALADIAAAYGCQSAVRGNTAENTERTMILVGTVSALDALRMLLPSIAMQMEASARFMTSSHVSDIRELRNYTRSELETERKRYYRSFVRAYGRAVAERIREFRARLQQNASPNSEGGSTGEAGGDGSASSGRGAALVLRDDIHRVNEEFHRQFPQLRKHRPERTHSAAGYRAGYRRGREAELGLGTPVSGGGTSTLTEGE
ncbi:hypothetical protein BJF83_11455 [Nocardiopsis sp. CNR-923]|uniref:DUF2786 domain-containing protein n=1 Tax=Nocardiopsis sp. CNR-923 TaxID=1904965 RepID=UPI0009650473|nr:DUF2786 domain-containing protein [Nocardiopsis sp. CNR-923]OLT29500.1 hypothetical protein BJF83_11455 [Nocardiopsis sp. CNR-923]